MAFITSPAIFQIRNAGGAIVSGNARVLQFSGEVSVVESAPGIVQIVVGGPGSGGNNTVAYFGPTGDLKSDPGFSFNESNFGLFYGQNLGGTISTGGSSLTVATVQNAGSVSGSQNGLTFGIATANGSVVSNGGNSFLLGRVTGLNARATIDNNSTQIIMAANVLSGQVSVLNSAACMILSANAGNGTLSVAATSSSIICVENVGGAASVQGQAHLIGGICSGAQPLNTAGNGSVVWGIELSNTADYSQTFGNGHVNSSYGALYIGTYSLVIPGTPGAIVSTDPLFIAGNGIDSSNLSNAYELYKDGKIVTTGSQTHRTRVIDVDTTLSDRTDRSIFVDVSGGPVQITFPAGVDGLEYFVKHIDGLAILNPITFVGTGGDTVELGANIILNNGARHFVYFNGVWRIMSSYN